MSWILCLIIIELSCYTSIWILTSISVQSSTRGIWLTIVCSFFELYRIEEKNAQKIQQKRIFFLIISLFHRRWGLFAFVAVLLLPGHSPLSIPHCVYAHVSLLSRWVHFYAGARVFAKIPSFVVFFAYKGRLPWRNLFYSCSTNFVETHGDQGPRSMFSLLFLLMVVVDHDYTHFSDLSLVDCGSTSI